MQLDPFIRDYRAFMDELVEALDARTTRFYLDTSLLMWLIRLGSAARSEFIDWCVSRPAGTVRVPVWAAHELHRHLIRGTVGANVRATVSETERKLDEFVRLAAERADEVVCKARGYTGRDGYVSEIEQSFARLRQLSKVVNDDTGLRAAADQVVVFVNKYVLATDLAPIVAALGQTGEFRYSHLMPPGYHDKKDENRYGDVVIWEEMVKDLFEAEGDERRHGVLISRDEKTDWVSSAPLIRSDQAEPHKSNRDLDLDVTRAHPLLVHEFVARARGDRLYIVHPGFLASALDYAARKSRRASAIAQWLAAAHRPDFLGRLAGASLALDPKGKTARSSDVASITDIVIPAPPARSGMSFAPPAVNELMNPSGMAETRAYEHALPTEKALLVAKWIEDLKSESLSSFRLGRIFADLVLAANAEWATQIPAVVEQLSSDIDAAALNGIALGAITPAYFDRYGELLRRPNAQLGGVALLLERDRRLEPAFLALKGYLLDAAAELPYLPGSGRGRVRYVVDLVEGTGNTPRVLRGVRIGDQSALIDPLLSDGPRRLSRLFGRRPDEGCTGLELRTLVGQEYLIPPELLGTDHDKRHVSWNPSAGLAMLDTGSTGGLSALADDGENDGD